MSNFLSRPVRCSRLRLYVLSAVLITAAAGAHSASAQLSTGTGSTIPDFAGFWAHPSLGFGPALSGPGPVRNTSRLPSGASNFDRLIGDYRNPILKPQAAELVRKRGEISASGKAFPDPDNQCLQNPVPYIFWNFDIQLLQEKDKVTIIYQHDDDARTVRLNQPHPARVVPSVHGDSVGHYEGDTLVVDTIGMNDKTFVDGFRTPHTTQLHVVERFRVVDGGKVLDISWTADDPGLASKPWGARRPRYRQNGRMDEDTCAANNDDRFNLGMDPVPRADKPDF